MNDRVHPTPFETEKCRLRQTSDIRVLIVEDEKPLRDVLLRAVTEWGFAVSSAWSGEEALRLNAEKPFDIAVMDFALPGCDGIETLAALRSTTPDIQGIIFTGSATIDVAKQAIHLGIVEFLIKPGSRALLEQALDRARRRLPELLPVAPQGAVFPPTAPPTLDQVERRHILATLKHNKNDRATTARVLGISPKTLYNKLQEYRRQGLIS
jgi:DNA-binding NtrC family response regulator